MTYLLDLTEKDTGVQPRPVTATEYSSACPVCGGSDRFRVWPEQGRFWCRGCGIQGDAIQYLRDVRGLTYQQACDTLGVQPRERERSGAPAREKPTWQPKVSTTPPEKWREKAMALVEWAEKCLWSPAGEKALRWLREERFLSDVTIKSSRLGWLPKDIWRDREAWGLDEQLNDQGRPKRLWLPQGLVIPLLQGNEVHRIRIRRPDPGDGPRYVVLPGSINAPMVLGENREVFVIVESELDTLLLNQEAGDLTGVVALGSASNRPDQRTTKLLRGARQILVALDGDDAGAAQAWRWWPENFNRVRRLPPVSGKDPGDMMKVGVNLRDWVSARLDQPRQVDSLSAGSSEDNTDSFDYLTHADEETMELFASVLVSIETGSQLGRLYPQMRGYLRRELGPELFRVLEKAHGEAAA